MARAPNQNFGTPGTRAASSAVVDDPAATAETSAEPSDDDLQAEQASDLQLLLARQQATIKRLEQRIESVSEVAAKKADKPAAKVAKPEVRTALEAAALSKKERAEGKSPRWILSEEGWYVPLKINRPANI